MDGCDGGAGDVLTLRVEAERRSPRRLFQVQNALQSACRTFHSSASGSRQRGSCKVPALPAHTAGTAAPALSSSITASSSCWLRSLQQQRNCMFTRTAALMSLSFCELTQVLILLTTGLSNKADQSAFDVLEGVVATKTTPTTAWKPCLCPSNTF